MAFLGSVVGAVVSVASTAISIISSVASTVGPVISSVAKVLVTKLPEIVTVIDVVANVVQAISNILGVSKGGETPEELGAKAMESDKKLEDFRSTEEYIQHLRDEVKLDSEKIKNMQPEERLAYTAIGTAILSKGIEEKKGILIPGDFWIEVGKQNMKAEEAKAYIDAFKTNGFGELKLSDYLKGNLSITENKEISSVITNTIKALNPDMSPEDIQKRVFDMKQISRDNEGR